MLNNIFLLLFFVFVAETTRDTYEHVPSVGRYIKVHRIPANWQEAQLRCQLEGGILASPESKNMLAAMLKIMADRQIFKVYTGIHATFSKGDYTTITGTPLSELDVEWMQGEPDNLNKEEDCLVMYSSGRLADVKCTNDYPFICHKSPEMMNAHKCSYSQDGIESSDYVLYNKTLSCYKFHKEGRFWSDAFRTCLAEDAYLAIINSEDESQFLKELFAQHLPEDIPGDFFKDSASIGFTRSDNDLESFVTIHGQSLAEAGFSAFQAGQPNNPFDDESCGLMWRTGLLQHHNCHERVAFICEKPLPNAHSCSYPEDDNSDYVLSNKTGSCYKFHKEGLFWPDAYDTCQKEDANLAIINSEAESQVLKELFAQNPPQDIPGDFFKGSASIGFRRSVNNEESFVTIDGQSLTEAGFTMFSDGEPNHIGNNEKCGSVMRNGLLNDHNCKERVAFICEKRVVPKFDLRSNY
ncbi:macrophage mannose receptor 1-like [Choristoneura fumiferana]|uniref:macrophage mannose receptor 1-like n=1 Tax=Choristoneura fumiferana TaxID=7141 RepID=UPI003D15425C